MREFAVIDIGGTSIKYGVINEDGEILDTFITDTNAYKGGISIINKVKDLIKLLQKNYNIDGICISTAGMVSTKEGKIIYAGPTIPDYTGIEVKKILEKEFSLPCSVENDVNCAALGEFNKGAAKGANSMACLTIGTGIGGALILGGKVVHGFSNSAGEIGYMIVNGKHIQDIASTSSLVRAVAYRKNLNESDINGRYVLDGYNSGDKICIEEVKKLADVLALGISNIVYLINPEVVVLGGGIMDREEVFRPLIEEVKKLADVLALGISNIVYLINPEVVVLGGGIMDREEVFRPLIEEYLKKYLIESVYINTKIEFAKLKNTAGMIGAFYNFRLSEM